MSPPAPTGPPSAPPPPLDVYKPLALIRSSTDFVTVSTHHTTEPRRSRDVTVTVTEGGWKTTRRVHDLSKANSATLPPKKRLDIPVPTITVVPTYGEENPEDYEIPTSYVRAGGVRAIMSDAVDYELTDADGKFLASHEVYGFGGSEAKRIRREIGGLGDGAGDADAAFDLGAIHESTRYLYDDGGDDTDAGGSGSELPCSSGDGVDLPRGKDKIFFTLTPSVLERGIDQLEKMTGWGHPVAYASFHKTFVSHWTPHGLEGDVTQASEISKTIYDYWMSKRVDLKMPLLRRFQPATSATDTNPHAVFRPRDKEKYKLRRSRKNDVESWRKMQLLRMDFERLKTMVAIIKKRSELELLQAKVDGEIFEQMIYDYTDTSGLPRTPGLDLEAAEEQLKIPEQVYSMGGSDPDAELDDSGDRKRKRERVDEFGGASENLETRVPVPLFTDFLPTRERYVVTPDGVDGGIAGAVSTYVSNYVDPRHIGDDSRWTYKHRGRIGRGGRVCVDRIVVHAGSAKVEGGERIVHAKRGGQDSVTLGSSGLLDLVGTPFNNPMIRESIREIAATYSDSEDEDCVDEDEWMSGESGGVRFVFGPI